MCVRASVSTLLTRLTAVNASAGELLMGDVCMNLKGEIRRMIGFRGRISY